MGYGALVALQDQATEPIHCFLLIRPGLMAVVFPAMCSLLNGLVKLHKLALERMHNWMECVENKRTCVLPLMEASLFCFEFKLVNLTLENSKFVSRASC